MESGIAYRASFGKAQVATSFCSILMTKPYGTMPMEMIHRVVLGSIERFIGVITEHFAGAFPTWLAPVQVKVLPITDRAAEYADQVAARLDALGYRVETDHRSEKIGFKIRQAQLEKVPYMLVVGDKEAETGDVAVRNRHGEQTVMSFDAFAAKLRDEVDSKALEQN